MSDALSMFQDGGKHHAAPSAVYNPNSSTKESIEFLLGELLVLF
jgi:hypothetical protein